MLSISAVILLENGRLIAFLVQTFELRSVGDKPRHTITADTSKVCILNKDVYLVKYNL